jgi:hypothetical protein
MIKSRRFGKPGLFLALTPPAIFVIVILAQLIRLPGFG